MHAKAMQQGAGQCTWGTMWRMADHAKAVTLWCGTYCRMSSSAARSGAGPAAASVSPRGGRPSLLLHIPLRCSTSGLPWACRFDRCTHRDRLAKTSQSVVRDESTTVKCAQGEYAEGPAAYT